MSQLNIYKTGRLSDKKIIELLDAIEKKLGNVNSNVHLGNLAVDYKAAENKKLIQSNDSTAITRADINTEAHKLNIKFRRGLTTNTDNVELNRTPSAHFDEVIITAGTARDANRQAPSPQEIIQCNEIIKKFVVNVIPENLESDANGVIAVLQSQIESSVSRYNDMMQGIDKRRAELDKEHDKKMSLLENNINHRLEEIESQRISEEEKIQKKKDALDKREATLDNRNNMHVRRELRQSINDEIKTRLSGTLVSKSASRMRWGVFGISLIASIIFGYISYSSISEFGDINSLVLNAGNNSVPDNGYASSLIAASGWFLILKTFLSSFAALGSLIFAIRWLSQLYLDDVREERELERYAYDINRASWAIETIMEMGATKGSLPPQTWIEAICGNLFNNSADKQTHIQNPLETILSSSAKVEFGPDGPKFELNKKGAKKLANEVANSQS